MSTSLVDIIRKEARELPLNDAAFQLWRYKHNFDVSECPRPSTVDDDDPADGPTFDRLKRAQPQAADADIRAAIKAAVKMWDDCLKHFDRDYTDFFAAIDTAIARAQPENPGFRQETWRAAGSYLLYLFK